MGKWILIAMFFFGCSQSVEWTDTEQNYLVDRLDGSGNDLLGLCENLNENQWRFKPDGGWSIAEIVEHVQLQESMHFREVYVLSKTPQNPDLASRTIENDSLVSYYENDPMKGVADWFVEPNGRWCTKESALTNFAVTRLKTLEFVKNTNADLRHHFTFRPIPDENDFRRVRDLHQVLLTTDAHTRRHIHQIKRVMNDPKFPLEEN